MSTDRWYKEQPEWGTPESTARARAMTPGQELDEKGKGLWANIHAKRKRGEKPNPPGHPDRPTLYQTLQVIPIDPQQWI